jgi:hypothetical protein
MGYPDTTTTDTHAFSLWPDALVSGEPQTVGYTRQGLANDNFSSAVWVTRLPGDKPLRSLLRYTGFRTLLA